MPESTQKKNGSPKIKQLHRDNDRKLSLIRKLDRILPDWLPRHFSPRVQRWALIAVTSLLAAFLLSPKSFHYYSLAVGEPAGETIVSPLTFKVIDEAATNKNRDEVLKSTRPVYDFDDEMVHDVQQRIISAFDLMRRSFTVQDSTPPIPQSDLPLGTASVDSKIPSDQELQTGDDNSLRTRFENILGATVYPVTFSVLKSHGFNSRIERDLRSLVVPILLKGVVLSRELLMRDGSQGILVITKSTKKLEPFKDLGSILDLQESFNVIDSEEKESDYDPSLSLAVRRLARDLIYVNITYNRTRTEALRQEALASVKPVFFQMSKGEQIIKQGEPANEGHLKKLAGLNKANPAYSRYMIVFGTALILIIVLRFCFYFAEKHLDRSKQATEDLLLFCVVLLGTIVLIRFMMSLSPLLVSAGTGLNERSILFMAPVATGAMLASLMVNARLAFIFAALTSLVAVLACEGDIYLFVFYLVSGVVGLHGMTKISDRTGVLRAGLVVGMVNMLSMLALKMAIGQLTRFEDSYEIGLGFLGGLLSGLLVSGLAPLLEPLGYTTNIRLLELASLNHPLLKELALQSPGTYHHSIIVGNIAESAAEIIGANPLLARVGALYHDIGKVGKATKSSYFIENQQRGVNPHDKLEPSMSALIIVSHVKNGVEKAKEYRLGSPIVDIIEQHHGTSLIKYFYVKALEKAEKTHQVVSEDKYRYPGPLPQSKEAALVMLADVSEAACRAFTDPNPAKVQKKVQSLILGLFTEGQLDQSNLTLKDIHAITKSFVRAIQGILHSRIDYPVEIPNQEKSNGDSRRQQTNPDPNSVGRSEGEGAANIRRLGL
jgi:cyclic-di-AMP phosphodiesterase PgpH